MYISQLYILPYRFQYILLKIFEIRLDFKNTKKNLILFFCFFFFLLFFSCLVINTAFRHLTLHIISISWGAEKCLVFTFAAMQRGAYKWMHAFLTTISVSWLVRCMVHQSVVSTLLFFCIYGRVLHYCFCQKAWLAF